MFREVLSRYAQSLPIIQQVLFSFVLYVLIFSILNLVLAFIGTVSLVAIIITGQLIGMLCS